MDSQLKRGMLDVCVLSAMRAKDTYGYQIIKDISPVIQISESTLYPILKRLEESSPRRSFQDLCPRELYTGSQKRQTESSLWR